MVVPKLYVHTLIPRCCECYLIGQQMNLRLLRGRSYPGLSGWAINTIIFVLISERWKKPEAETQKRSPCEDDAIACHGIPRWSVATKRQRKAWNGSSQDSLGEVQPSMTLFQTSLLQNNERTHLFLKPPHLW